MAFLDNTGLEHFVDKVRNESYDAWRDKIQEYIDDSYDYQRLVYTTSSNYLPQSSQIESSSSLASLFEGSGDIFSLVALYYDDSSDYALNEGACYTSLYHFLYNCSNLIYADLSWLDLTNCTNIEDCFTGCTMLHTLRIILPDIDVDLTDCPLDEDSVEYIINNLPSSSNGSVLSLSSESYEYVTDALAEYAERMGWNVVTMIVITEDGETIVDEEDNIVITE